MIDCMLDIESHSLHSAIYFYCSNYYAFAIKRFIIIFCVMIHGLHKL